MILPAVAAMVSPRFLCSLCLSFFFSFFLIPISQRHLGMAQPDFQIYVCVERQGNFTTNSTYKANLDHLLSTFTTDHQIDYGFYNFSYGHQNRANAIGLCRGDLQPDSCGRCLNNSRDLLPRLCPNRNEAIGWYDECMLRYSRLSIFASMETFPAFYAWNPNNASDPERFIQVARNLLQQLAGKAASGDSRLKFATGEIAIPNFPIIYGAVQCTPDLSEKNCSGCLLDALEEIRDCCGGKAGGRIGRPSCSFRFESYKFFQETPPPSTPPNWQPAPSPLPTPPRRNASRRIVILVVPIIVGVVAGGLVIIGICIFLRTRKQRKQRSYAHKSPPEDETTDVEFSQFDFDNIRVATDGFSDANKLGEGGFGAVYKGRLPNGQVVAVKRLSRGSSQGDAEFKNEVLLVTKLQHRNLVQLLGFCFKDNEKLLIYEFVENSSLEKFLFNPVRCTSLDWKTRYNIIGGIVRGLVYLHEESQLRIIHRDLKASNILLDADMNAKISDFGTARLFAHDQTQGDTKRIVGTHGYMAPEYVQNGHFSIKSDVFSFGVLVLEIVTGLKNNQSRTSNESVEGLVSYAWRNWQKGTALNIIDPFMKSGSRAKMVRYIHIGLLCVQENLAKRPTMSAILLMLNSYSITLPRPSQPTFIIDSASYQHSKQSESNSTQELNDMSITELDPR